MPPYAHLNKFHEISPFSHQQKATTNGKKLNPLEFFLSLLRFEPKPKILNPLH